VTDQIRFDDGSAYERMMGVWSQLVGAAFLDWLAPPPDWRWADVGCGNGAFTELLMERCAPADIQAIDPSDGQLAYARRRITSAKVEFHKGDAMELPFEDNSFDASVMALVLFFVPEPARGVAEMVRVVRPGGSVSAYLWDMLGGGFPMEPIQAELRAAGLNPVRPPSVGVSRLDALRQAWLDAGLDGVETTEITVSRTFDDFDQFWSITTSIGTSRSLLASLPADEVGRLKERVRARLPADAGGRISYEARANAIKGRVPIAD
jgi:SAM-dependent methyltransferase